MNPSLEHIYAVRDIVNAHGKASTSLIQRRLKVSHELAKELCEAYGQSMERKEVNNRFY